MFVVEYLPLHLSPGVECMTIPFTDECRYLHFPTKAEADSWLIQDFLCDECRTEVKSRGVNPWSTYCAAELSIEEVL